MSNPRPLLRRISSIILIFGFLLLPVTAQQDPRAIDPADVFFQAWLTVRDAKKLEKKGQFNDARLKYEQAAKYYNLITRFHKNWKPSMVQTRIKTTREAIKEIESKSH